MKQLTATLIPGALSLAAAGAVMFLPDLRGPVSRFLADYPLLLLAVGCLLALVYRRRRALYALVSVGVAGWAWWLAGQGDEELARAVTGVVAVLLPVTLLVVGVCRERPPLSPAGLAGLGAMALPPLVLAYCWHSYQLAVFRWPWMPLWGTEHVRPCHLPDASLLAFGVALVGLGVKAAVSGDPLDGGLWFALLGCLGALGKGPLPAQVPLFFHAAALAVVTSLLFASARWAFTDALTGLPGRRACEEALAQLGTVFTVAVVDVDHFKAINDRFGHGAGDQVLRMVATRLAEVGGSGRAFRWGGEEFVVIFANRPLERSLPFLEGVHRSISATPFRIRGADRPRRRPKRPVLPLLPTQEVTVTVSLGVADSKQGQRRSAEEAIRAADAALYRAKNTGRNRICTA